MKRYRIRVYLISALGLLFGLGQGSSLDAQNQSQPQATACPLEGPSMADTLKYVNDSLALNGTNLKLTGGTWRIDTALVSVHNDRLVLDERQEVISRTGEAIDGTGSFHTYSFPIYGLTCNAHTSRQEDGLSTVEASCEHSMSCGKEHIVSDDGTVNEASTDHLVLWYGTDNEHSLRLARALSHLIALLQQQYKQSHSDPSDPFAKPQ
jgi:hypothetical protein